MAGIYIHIPFCRSRCIYCGFYSTTNLELRQRYVEAVCREMKTYPFPLPEGMGIDTIYLGGGTPSQLTIPQLRQLFININKVYSLPSIQGGVGGEPEITIEVNPDDVTDEFAAALQQFGINRVSMGAQTFDDERLRWLHRRHTSKQVGEAVRRLREAGIRNISIDLMYGFPDETLSDWQHDIDAALALNVEHLSAYCLMIEEGTPLYQMMHNGDRHNGDCPQCVDEETERQMYEMLIDKLEAAGYEHYEISNFARPGYRSRHNSGYWNDTPYIGLGAAAHSYDGHTRSWNIADIHQYIDGIENGKRLFDSEVIEGNTRYNDRLTVALRTREGIDLSTLSDYHRDYAIKNARRFINDGLLHITPANHLALTRRGLFVSDMIISELMLV
ncbi:MAG: radical SAM family heme chaperone HemW [Prevotella sp.]|nr:radical SAM family heme chaperone HemW [Prevotella sp.]